MKKNYAIYVFAIVIAAGIMRLIFAAHGFYDPEEYAYVIAVKTHDLSRFIGMMKEFRTACLDIVYLKILYGVSSNEMFIRAAYVAVATVFVALAYFLTLNMSRSHFIAFATMIMTALSPLHVFYAQIIRYHGFVCAFTALSIYYFYKTMTQERAGWKNAVAYGLSTALALMFHYYVFYLIAAQGAAFLVLRGRSLKAWKTYASTQIFTVVFFIPWLPIFKYDVTSRVESTGFGAASIIRQFQGTGILNIADAMAGFIIGDSWDIHDDALKYKLLLLAALASVAVAIIYSLIRYFKEKSELAAYVFILLSVSTILAFSTREATGMVFAAKFMLPFSVLFYILIAYGMEKAPGAVRTLTVVSFLCIFGWSYILLLQAAMEKPNIKTVASEIAARPDGEFVVVTNGATCADNIKEYAGSDLDIVVASRIPEGRSGYMINEEVNVNDITRTIKAISHYDDAWLFYCVLGYERNIGDVPTTAEDPYGKIYSAISSQMDLEETKQFKISPRKLYFVSRAYKFKRK